MTPTAASTATRSFSGPPEFPFAAHFAGAVRLAEVQPANTRWLWPGKIPLGRVTLLVSDPGLGKSLLTLDIAARVSRGAPWPDHKAATGGRVSDDSPLPVPSSVLLLTSEDDLADTVRPWLEAIGADLQKIVAIANVPGESAGDVPRAFALNRDLARLRNLLDAMSDCCLIVIDPISAFLGTTNEHGNTDIRTLLAALTTVARERNIAVLIVSHLRKKEGAAIHRTMGSLAFVAGARAAWALCKDPADDNRRLLLPIKNNLARKTAGLAFTIESSAGHDAPTIRWAPDPVDISVETIFAMGRAVGRPDDERQQAISWLQERLAKKARAISELREESDAFGISYPTLRRAFRELGGEAARQGIPPFNRWVWKLPETPETTDQNTGGEFWTSNPFPFDLAELAKPFMPKSTPRAEPQAP